MFLNVRTLATIFESARRLLSWSGQQKTNVLASLRPAYIIQHLGVSRQIIRLSGISRLMCARLVVRYFYGDNHDQESKCLLHLMRVTVTVTIILLILCKHSQILELSSRYTLQLNINSSVYPSHIRARVL